MTADPKGLVEADLADILGVGFSNSGVFIINPNAWSVLNITEWRQLAFLRYLEIWEKVTVDRLVRATDGTETLRRSFSGILGAMNSKGGIRKAKGVWEVANLTLVYPKLKRMSEAGIRRAKQLAWELAKNEGGQA